MVYKKCLAKNAIRIYLKLIKNPDIRYICTVYKDNKVTFLIKFKKNLKHVEEITNLDYLERLSKDETLIVFNPIKGDYFLFNELIVMDKSVVSTHTFIKDDNNYLKIIFGGNNLIFNPVKKQLCIIEELKNDLNVKMSPYKLNGDTHYYFEFIKENRCVYMPIWSKYETLSFSLDHEDLHKFLDEKKIEENKPYHIPYGTLFV
ncbi:hypothetical protein AGMMS49579_01130 [Spirochaetia bacterium]|nr:hypothetical protein AGMMS49579_01130 [Spirochaetia bacterium]